jgi:hypothetical protein
VKPAPIKTSNMSRVLSGTLLKRSGVKGPKIRNSSYDSDHKINPIFMSTEDQAVEETAKAVQHYLDNILTAPLSESLFDTPSL